MKFLAICAMLCGMSIAFAAEVVISNTLSSSKVGADRPYGWSVSVTPKDAGSGKIIQLEGSQAKAFQADIKGGSANYWRNTPIAVKAGDKVTISMDVTGKGLMNVGIYTYTGIANFFPAVRGTTTVTLNGKKQQVKIDFIVRNGAKGQICENIRPFFRVEKNSSAIIENYTVKVIKN